MEKRQCAWCPRWFFSDRRLKERQRSCGSPECKRQQKLLSHQCWKKRERAAYRQNQKDWQKSRPTYWQEYRKKNPEYVERNRIQSRIRKSSLKLGLQKRIDILELTENTMEYWNLPRFAKSTQWLVPLLWAYTGPHERSFEFSP